MPLEPATSMPPPESLGRIVGNAGDCDGSVVEHPPARLRVQRGSFRRCSIAATAALQLPDSVIRPEREFAAKDSGKR
jgi:hypothetical protein